MKGVRIRVSHKIKIDVIISKLENYIIDLDNSELICITYRKAINSVISGVKKLNDLSKSDPDIKSRFKKSLINKLTTHAIDLDRSDCICDLYANIINDTICDIKRL